jgi:hypothetical protein
MKILSIMFLLFLAGCAQLGNLPAPGIHPTDAPITQREFIRTDVQTALDLATQNGDKQGQNCFGALLAVLPTTSAPATQPTGLVSIYEAGRVARMGLQAGLPDSVTSACAPLILNSQAALLNGILFLRP